MKLLEWVRHYFVPHYSNNHKAKILHPATISVVVAVFLVYQFGINFFLLVSPSVLGYASNITPEQVIEMTNKKRLENGLPPLVLNGTLSEAAQRKAGDMFAFNYWAHNSPSGRDPWSFFHEVNYQYLYAGENLARDFMNSASVVDAWMSSPTHRDNILNSRYQEVGLAVVNGTLEGAETTLVVQLFATPTPTPIVAETRSPELGRASSVEEKIPLVSTVFAQAEEAKAPVTSPFALTKTMAILFLGILLGALILDVILVTQKRIVRLSGRNLAHLIFITMLLLAVVLTTQGAIL